MARANQHWSAKQARDTQSEAFIIYIINAKKYIYFRAKRKLLLFLYVERSYALGGGEPPPSHSTSAP